MNADALAIAQEVAAKHRLTILELRTKARIDRLFNARHELYYRIANETTLRFSTLARFLEVDRTTILHGIAAHCHKHQLPLPRAMTYARYYQHKQALEHHHATRRSVAPRT